MVGDQPGNGTIDNNGTTDLAETSSRVIEPRDCGYQYNNKKCCNDSDCKNCGNNYKCEDRPFFCNAEFDLAIVVNAGCKL